jgi:predicted phosphodiesterase
MSSTKPDSKDTQVKTRFLIISDTHSASPTQNATNSNVAFRPPLPKADVLLHCGDLTMVGHLYEYERTLDMLESIDAELKLVIAGNHDISLDDTYFKRKGEYMHRRHGYDEDLPVKAREMWLGDRAKRTGVTYLEEGTHTFTLKTGAKLRVRSCTILCVPSISS